MNDSESLDPRPVRPRDFFKDVIQGWIDPVRAKHRDNPEFTDAMKARLDYIEAVLLHGNMSGRQNKTVDLPDRWTCGDVEAVLGVNDDHPPASGSDAAWRGVRKHFDAVNSGRSVGGRAI